MNAAQRKHAEPYAKVTTVLFERQVAFLDRLSLEIRAKTAKVVNRAAILRALTDALEGSGLEVTGCGSEAELAELLTARLRGKRSRAKKGGG